MAEENVNPDKLAQKWFMITVVAAAVYFGTAYFFVIAPEVVHPGMEGTPQADD